MTQVVLPKANENDLETLPQEVLDNVTFTLVKSMDEVMDAVLARRPDSARKERNPDIGVPLPHG